MSRCDHLSAPVWSCHRCILCLLWVIKQWTAGGFVCPFICPSIGFSLAGWGIDPLEEPLSFFSSTGSICFPRQYSSGAESGIHWCPGDSGSVDCRSQVAIAAFILSIILYRCLTLSLSEIRSYLCSPVHLIGVIGVFG